MPGVEARPDYALGSDRFDVCAFDSGEEAHRRCVLDPWEREPEGIDLDSVLDDLRCADSHVERAGRLQDVFTWVMAALSGWIRAAPVHPADLAQWAGHELGEAVDTHGAWLTGEPRGPSRTPPTPARSSSTAPARSTSSTSSSRTAPPAA